MSGCKYGIVDHKGEACTCAEAFAAAGVQGPPRLSDLGRMTRDDRQGRADRERARAMFIAAGKPIPAWARDGQARALDASACVESEDELLHNATRDGEP